MASSWSAWKAVQALTQVNRYWGIITVGWVPMASLGAATIIAVTAMCLWQFTDSKSKPGLLAGQIAMQLLWAGSMLLTMLCWLHPSKVDPQVCSPICQIAKLNKACLSTCSCTCLLAWPHQMPAANTWCCPYTIEQETLNFVSTLATDYVMAWAACWIAHD